MKLWEADLVFMLPTVQRLKLKYIKQSLPQKHQATLSHIPLLTMGKLFIWVKNYGDFPIIYINSLNCGSKNAGSE